MTILLADDERLTRLSLQSMIEELFPNKYTYIHAKNGNEVISLLGNYKPDIAFLDIKMPYLTGLEALERCRLLSPETICIILTGYAEFEYAQKAVSLSAFEYILKPIDLNTVKNLFEHISIHNKTNKVQNNIAFSHDVISSFNLADQFSANEVDFSPVNSSDYIFYQFYIDAFDQKMQKSIKQKLHDELTLFCDENTIVVSYCIFFNNLGNLCLLCDIPDATRLTHFISMQVGNLPPYSFSVFWGNAKTIRKIYEISTRITQISDLRIIKDCTHPMFIKDIEALPFLSTQLKLAKSIIAIISEYIAGNMASYRKKLDVLQSEKIFREAFAFLSIPTLKNYLQYFFPNADLLNFYTFDEMITELETVSQQLTCISKPATDISAIKDYVYKNYSKDVGISTVSELFNLSPSYLSRLFHEKTGQKYIDFVTEVRMNVAKQILTEYPNTSIKDLAESTGYNSVRHFSKTFQKYFGLLPSEYRSS